ncbi:glycine--tRNA ligase subunit beta [Anaerobiospirillum thomasii]|uniref:Glycine--tRNA ligase beta subunit n=1 Tax=Anaerobiospirillum thomasii TaxID=179995 RepID=A0A2X0V7V8_9GAMM|nr:glycine--tRNA ligase subunit beta [Anaerobiospirillum thomasii]SPT69186.1 Glycine--tRNA ligase beta subunit [Anaerobiospirillum thomasii]
MSNKNLLLELGTEELPPKSLRKLSTALLDEFTKRLDGAGLKYDGAKWYATPRRLSLFIASLDEKQEDREIEIKGPSVKVAYDANGEPTKAALGWANSNGVDIKDVSTLKTEKGEWLYIKSLKKGDDTTSLIPQMFKESLESLPIPKLMHWGDKKEEFVRPVHTLCMLFGSDLISGTILGLQSGTKLLGHRFMGKQQVELTSADNYLSLLENEGYVIADYERRKTMIKEQVIALANSIGGQADLDEDLLEEVTSLVEYPHAFLASFEERFLQVPSEALVYTMKGDQKYFPIYDAQNKLLPKFIFISNINPSDTTSLISGNERVVRPRLSDAEFFFKTDRKHSLESYFDKLTNVIYQKDIGTIAYRSEIVEQVAAYIGEQIGADQALCKRASHLAKCDLATTLVNEFTDTQGIMGMHYARLDGENADVADAIFEQYLPRFAGDKVPTGKVQIALSLAEKITTLVAIFGINLAPKGDKDPYGLRRAAIGVIRIMLENKLDMNLNKLLSFTYDLLTKKMQSKTTVADVSDYVFNRLKAYYKDLDIGAEIFNAVYANTPDSILDFDKRVYAVKEFKALDAASDLAAAYKRVANILSKAENVSDSINESLLEDSNEKQLVERLAAILPVVSSYYEKKDYLQALSTLSELREDVDNFFENVMVNVEDINIKNNRLSILLNLKMVLAKTADISVLY